MVMSGWRYITKTDDFGQYSHFKNQKNFKMNIIKGIKVKWVQYGQI